VRLDLLLRSPLSDYHDSVCMPVCHVSVSVLSPLSDYDASVCMPVCHVSVSVLTFWMTVSSGMKRLL
jgi:hypothetical protein